MEKDWLCEQFTAATVIYLTNCCQWTHDQNPEIIVGVRRPPKPACGVRVHTQRLTKPETNKHKELMKRNGKNEQLTTYSCDFCPKVFRWRYQLKYHKEKKHIDLKKGKHVHADKRKFSCDLCNKEYTSKQNLQFHQSRVHSHRIGKNR